MRKFLHVSIVWGSTAKSPNQLKPIFDLADDWITYGGNNWIIYTAEASVTWQGRVMAVLNISEDFCFISEIANVHETTGFLPGWVWEWLRKPRIDNSGLQALLPPINPTFR
jgi:hypothetical protein